MSWNSWLFPNPSTQVMESLVILHDYLCLILALVTLFVFLSMAYVISFQHFDLSFMEDEGLEIIWTMFPFFLILSILMPSLSALYLLDSCSLCGLNMNIMGHQWYWSYFYKETEDMLFDSYMLPSEVSAIRVLDADNRVALPVSVPVRCVLSSSDVLHSWAVPSMGVKMDAVPGRLNQFCFCPTRVGVFFGQCSEICGANHSFMPIVLEIGPILDFSKSLT